MQVSVDHRPAGATATITDVGRLAVEQYKAIYAQVVVRAVLRRAAKEAILYGAEEGLKKTAGNNSLAKFGIEVGGLLGGLAWEGSESADCRCWGLLPERIQVLRLEMPAGVHRIGLRADAGFVPPAEQEKTVRIDDGRNTYLLATFADGRLIGNILSSDAPEVQAPPVKLAQGR